CIPSEELHQDTTNAPNIAGEAPPEVQDDFWCTIVTRGYDGGMIFVIKGSGAKVNKPNLGIEQYSSVTCRTVCSGRGGWDIAVVCEGLVIALDKQNVLRLEIGMDEVKVV